MIYPAVPIVHFESCHYFNFSTLITLILIDSFHWMLHSTSDDTIGSLEHQLRDCTLDKSSLFSITQPIPNQLNIVYWS